MSQGPLQHRLRSSLSPSDEAQKRVRARLRQRMGAEHALSRVQEALRPQAGAQERIWNRVQQALPSVSAQSVFDRVRGFLTPAAATEQSVYRSFAARLRPAPTFHISVPLKWVASFAIFMLLVKAGPQAFLAPRSVADAAVTLFPTRGEVAISIGGLWQPVTQEITLKPGVLLRTYDGEASILFRDEGVVRLDANTVIALHDTSPRLEPAPELLPTFTLQEGRVWMQGLIPSQLRGITVASADGFITVNEGSVSVATDDDGVVSVWDRRATIATEERSLTLIAGEWTELGDAVSLVKHSADDDFENEWVTQNLERDAVHRRSIAQAQHERRISQAGILPTSTFYSVKRIAEEMDVLMTLGEEARVEKRIAHAETRLNEAAALLSEGQEETAAVSLEEYRVLLSDLASGSGTETAYRFLVQRSLAETVSATTAAVPGDDAYIIKKSVLEATAGIPDSMMNHTDVQGIIVLDAVAALTHTVQGGGTGSVKETWVDLQPYLALLDDDMSDVSADIRKEAAVLLEEFAQVVSEQEQTGFDPEFLADVSTYLPEVEVIVPVLTDEEVSTIVEAIRGRIFLFDLKQSRINQFLTEMRAIAGHPEQGRILRRLYQELPDGPEQFPDRVRRIIAQLRWEKTAN